MVVAPVAVDVDVPTAQPFVPEAELLHHAQTRRVLGTDADLHAMQPVLLERGIRRQRDRRRGDPAPGEALADPVADRRRAQRPARDTPDVELPGDLAVVLHHERVADAVTVLLQQPTDAEPHVEGGDPAGDRRLPGLLPGAVGQQFALQRARIARADQSQSDRAVLQRSRAFEGHIASGA